MFLNELLELKKYLLKVSSDKEALSNLDILIKEAIRAGGIGRKDRLKRQCLNIGGEYIDGECIVADEEPEEPQEPQKTKEVTPAETKVIKEPEPIPEPIKQEPKPKPIELIVPDGYCKQNNINFDNLVQSNSLTKDCKVLLCFLNYLFTQANDTESSKNVNAYLSLYYKWIPSNKETGDIETTNALIEQVNGIVDSLMPKVKMLGQKESTIKIFSNHEGLKSTSTNLSNLNKVFEKCLIKSDLLEEKEEEVIEEVITIEETEEPGGFSNKTIIEKTYNKTDSNYTGGEERVKDPNPESQNNILEPETYQSIRESVESAIDQQKTIKDFYDKDQEKFRVVKPYDCNIVLSNINLTYNYKDDSGLYSHRVFYSKDQKNILLWHLAEKDIIPVEIAELLTDEFFAKQEYRRPSRGGDQSDFCLEQVKDFINNTMFRKKHRSNEMMYFLDYLEYYNKTRNFKIQENIVNPNGTITPGKQYNPSQDIKILKQFFNLKTIELEEAKAKRLRRVIQEVKSPSDYFEILFENKVKFTSKKIRDNIEVIKKAKLSIDRMISQKSFKGMGSEPPKALAKFSQELNKIIELYSSDKCLDTCYYGDDKEGLVFKQICQQANKYSGEARSRVIKEMVKKMLMDTSSINQFYESFVKSDDNEKKKLYSKIVALSPNTKRERGQAIEREFEIQLTDKERRQLSALNCFDQNGMLIVSNNKRVPLKRKYRISELTMGQGDYGEISEENIEYLLNLIKKDIENLKTRL